MTPLSKRELLRTLAAITTIAAVGPALASAPDVDAAAAGEIGRAWLAQHPSDAAKLRAEFGTEALSRLRERVRADFERDALFTHTGWFVSHTEARLCALIALS